MFFSFIFLWNLFLRSSVKMKSMANILILVITMVSQWNFCDKLCVQLNGNFVSSSLYIYKLKFVI